jgi:hypothetical protein
MKNLGLAVVLMLAVCACVQAQEAAVAAGPKAKPAPVAQEAGRAGQDAAHRLEPAVRFDVSATPRKASERERGDGAPRRAAPGRRTGRDTLDLGTTSITGNQELPKVLYIVPWKESDLGDVIGRPANTLLDDVLAPLDPAVFARRLKYYETLHGTKDKGVTR